MGFVITFVLFNAQNWVIFFDFLYFVPTKPTAYEQIFITILHRIQYHGTFTGSNIQATMAKSGRNGKEKHASLCHR